MLTFSWLLLLGIFHNISICPVEHCVRLHWKFIYPTKIIKMSTKFIRYMFIWELSLMRRTHLLLPWIILPLEALIIVKSLFYVCNVICRCLCLFSFYSPSYFPLKTLRKYNKCKRLLHIYGLYYCSTNRLCWKLLLWTILEKLLYSL